MTSLEILTIVLVFLTLALVVAATLSIIGSVQLKKATDKLAVIELNIAGAYIIMYLKVPKQWLGENIAGLEEALQKLFPPRTPISEDSKKDMSPELLRSVQQIERGASWDSSGDTVDITFPVNLSHPLLMLLSDKAREPGAIRDLFCNNPLIAMWVSVGEKGRL